MKIHNLIFVGWPAFLGLKKLSEKNERDLAPSKILQEFGKVLCTLWKLTIHLPSKLLRAKQGNRNRKFKALEALMPTNASSGIDGYGESDQGSGDL